MNGSWTMLFLIVLLFLGNIQAQTGQAKRASKSDKQSFNWEVTVRSGVLVPQKARVFPSRNVVIVTTVGSVLDKVSLTPSVMLVNTSSQLMAMKAASRTSPCYLTGISATLPEMMSDLNAWNNSRVTLMQFVSLDGTSEPLDSRQTAIVYNSNKAIRRFCQGFDLVRTKPVVGNLRRKPKVKTLTMLGYSVQISLIVPDLSPQRPRDMATICQGQRNRTSGSGGDCRISKKTVRKMPHPVKSNIAVHDLGPEVAPGRVPHLRRPKQLDGRDVNSGREISVPTSIGRSRARGRRVHTGIPGRRRRIMWMRRGRASTRASGNGGGGMGGRRRSFSFP